MDTALNPAHSSLAQRIAKIRNCMLVEVLTGVPAIDKDLFVSLCQAYEQQNALLPYLLGESNESLPSPSVSRFTQGTSQPLWSISTLSRNIPSWQRCAGFLATNQADEDPPGGKDDSDDWSKTI